MNFFRVGVVDFFGILCPGVLLMINILVFLFALDLLEDTLLEGLKEFDEIFLLLLVFVICYLFGFVLRLISPDKVDKVAYWYGRIRHFRKRSKLVKKLPIKGPSEKEEESGEKKKPKNLLEAEYKRRFGINESLPPFFWKIEPYPYYWGMMELYRGAIPHKNEHLKKILGDKGSFRKGTLNYWKILVLRSDANLATIVIQAEAFVRFMSGSFWALLIGFFAGFVYIVTHWGEDSAYIGLFVVYIVLSLVMWFILLTRFKDQRRREVKVIVDSILTLCQTEDGFTKNIGIQLPDADDARKPSPPSENPTETKS